MEYGSNTYRVYTPAELKSIPPTAIPRRSHAASSGGGWSAFAFVLFVGAMIGGGTYGAMRLVKPDAPVATSAGGPASTELPIPAPVPAVPPPPTPGAHAAAVPAMLTTDAPAAVDGAAKPLPKSANDARDAKDAKARPRPRPQTPRLPRAIEPAASAASAAPVPVAPPNPYEAL